MLRLWAWIAPLVVSACATEGLTVTPLGDHTVEVGQVWSQVLAAQSDLPVTWSIAAGPADLLLVVHGQTATLRWSPTLADLAATPPGQARLPGSRREVVVQVADADGQVAVSRGTVRAVPATVPSNMQAP